MKRILTLTTLVLSPCLAAAADDVELNRLDKADIASLSASFSSPAADLPALSKIIGGVEAVKGEFPFIVSFQDASGHFCAGSLIKKNWVLTAAHCARGNALEQARVVIGAHDLRDTAGAETFGVADVKKYSRISGSLDYDFTLVRLDGESQFPPIAPNRKELSGRMELVVAGWGRTNESDATSAGNILRKAAVQLVPPDRCAKAYSEDPSAPELTRAMICAGKNQSKGDSGGPLIMGAGPDRVLAGVVSWHLPGKYGVFAKVSSVISWIEKVAGPF